MKKNVFVYDPTASDKLSSVRGIGRYLKTLKENFPDWTFTNKLAINNQQPAIFINPFINFLQSPVVTKKIAQKQIAVIHDLISLKYPAHFPAGLRGNINIYRNRLALKNYDLIITDSEASKKDVINILGLSEEKIKVIYPCLPKIFLNSQSVISNQKITKLKYSELRITNYCLYVGDATWNKNLVNLAKSIKIANVNCIFVGKIFEQINSEVKDINFNHPWQRELKQFVEEVKDDKRFVFTGFVSDSDLIKLYQQAMLNVLPSRDEGFGFSYLESASLGCPSVLSSIPVLKEISDNNCLFADPNNPNEIADKIKDIYFNKDLRNTLGSEAFERSRFFSSHKFKEDFLNILK